TLKNRGYNFSHNFGHGKTTLSYVLVTLMLLAFLINTVSSSLYNLYIKIREKYSSKNTFINDIRTLTKFITFDSFNNILLFMHISLYRCEYSDTS
ncbi:MAG: ISNCY family transposase, partial [Deltaproteobacteria bacterium]|nr:ISNCY family transposase [Deltaproteobacteria bacterium]